LAIRLGYRVDLSLVPLPSGFVDEFTIHLNPDWRVLIFAFAISIAAAVLFGIAPALNPAKATAGNGRSRFRDALVVAQVGICLALLVGSSLMLRKHVVRRDNGPGLSDGALVLRIVRSDR
jgi:hypothetical protein